MVVYEKKNIFGGRQFLSIRCTLEATIGKDSNKAE